MAFESVNVESIKGAISSCLNSINYSKTNDIVNNIVNDNVWNTESRNHLKNALVKLTETRFNQLKQKLGVANQVANLIEDYKSLEQDNSRYRNQISSLQPRLYYDENYISGYWQDDFGTSHAIWSTRTVKDYNIENSINNLNNKIRHNNEKMSSLESKVSSIIGGM